MQLRLAIALQALILQSLVEDDQLKLHHRESVDGSLDDVHCIYGLEWQISVLPCSAANLAVMSEPLF